MASTCSLTGVVEAVSRSSVDNDKRAEAHSPAANVTNETMTNTLEMSNASAATNMFDIAAKMCLLYCPKTHVYDTMIHSCHFKPKILGKPLAFRNYRNLLRDSRTYLGNDNYDVKLCSLVIITRRIVAKLIVAYL